MKFNVDENETVININEIVVCENMAFDAEAVESCAVYVENYGAPPLVVNGKKLIARRNVYLALKRLAARDFHYNTVRCVNVSASEELLEAAIAVDESMKRIAVPCSIEELERAAIALLDKAPTPRVSFGG